MSNQFKYQVQYLTNHHHHLSCTLPYKTNPPLVPKHSSLHSSSLPSSLLRSSPPRNDAFHTPLSAPPLTILRRRRSSSSTEAKLSQRHHLDVASRPYIVRTRELPQPLPPHSVHLPGADPARPGPGGRQRLPITRPQGLRLPLPALPLLPDAGIPEAAARGRRRLRGPGLRLGGRAEPDAGRAEAPPRRDVPVADEQRTDMDERRPDERRHVSRWLSGGGWEREGGCEEEDYECS